MQRRKTEKKPGGGVQATGFPVRRALRLNSLRGNEKKGTLKGKTFVVFSVGNEQCQKNYEVNLFRGVKRIRLQQGRRDQERIEWTIRIPREGEKGKK